MSHRILAWLLHFWPVLSSESLSWLPVFPQFGSQRMFKTFPDGENTAFRRAMSSKSCLRYYACAALSQLNLSCLVLGRLVSSRLVLSRPSNPSRSNLGGQNWPQSGRQTAPRRLQKMGRPAPIPPHIPGSKLSFPVLVASRLVPSCFARSCLFVFSLP